MNWTGYNVIDEETNPKPQSYYEKRYEMGFKLDTPETVGVSLGGWSSRRLKAHQRQRESQQHRNPTARRYYPWRRKKFKL